MKRIEVPVLISGAGPVGLSAGILLQRLGIGHCVVERRMGPQRVPAAHVVNARTFEIWRQAGVDLKPILGAALDPVDAGFVYWVTRLGGEVLGRLQYEQQGDDMLAHTPTPLRNLSQHRLEPLLVEVLSQQGYAPRYGQQWESATQDRDGVTSRIRDLETNEVYEVHSRYLLAADGAGSPIRKALGIPQFGPDRLQSCVMIHVEANLRSLVRHHPGIMYWLCDPECPGVLVAHDIDREWVLMHPWDPDREKRDDYTPERCEALVRKALAQPDVDLAVRTVSTWTMTAQVAERYREGRIFLVGDAAHRFPPTGGLGLNTGVQDVHNLLWKIAAVEAGTAGPELLATYEVERRPVAQHNAEQSLGNAMRLLEVRQALGTTEDLEESRAALSAVLTDPARRSGLDTAIANQAEHFDLLGLQLGYAYEAGVLVTDGTARPSVANQVRDFAPSSRPGSRLPHGWLRTADRRVSSLDLVSPDRFVLFVRSDRSDRSDGSVGSDRSDTERWTAAALEVALPLDVVVIGADVTDPDDWWHHAAGMPAGGALLVRPDQHVACRWLSPPVDPAASLASALRQMGLGAAARAGRGVRGSGSAAHVPAVQS